MVKMQEPSDSEKLDGLMEKTCQEHGFKLHTGGWSRKTYDVYLTTEEPATNVLMARIETYAIQSGEIRVFDERALPFAQSLGEALERTFPLEEAVIVRQRPPE